MHLRPIEPRDDAAVAAIIREVMPAFGAGGAGFAVHDAEVDAMSAAYAPPRAAYFVLEDGAGAVLGGGGFGPLAGAAPSICELRKMYFLPAARGGGWGRKLITLCIERAREAGYRTMYLETLSGMDAAQHLYEQLGFDKLCARLGQTGHGGCDRFMSRAL